MEIKTTEPHPHPYFFSLQKHIHVKIQKITEHSFFEAAALCDALETHLHLENYGYPALSWKDLHRFYTY